MKKPVIAIVPKTGENEREESKFCYALPRFIHAISACGGIPIILNNIEDTFQESDLTELLSRVDGVLFSGGPDIHPGLYGEEMLDCCGTLASERDALEIPLMREALRMDKPVLGVCRGFQVFNVVQGGTLYQDINTQLKSSVHIEHRRDAKEEQTSPMHKVNVIRETRCTEFAK